MPPVNRKPDLIQPSHWPERITHVALDLGGYLFCIMPPPARHHDCIHKVFEFTGKAVGAGTTQGFWTSANRFVDRKEGCIIARAANQLIRKTGPDDVLFSEDLW